jgi:hypothetical protein
MDDGFVHLGGGQTDEAYIVLGDHGFRDHCEKLNDLQAVVQQHAQLLENVPTHETVASAVHAATQHLATQKSVTEAVHAATELLATQKSTNECVHCAMEDLATQKSVNEAVHSTTVQRAASTNVEDDDARDEIGSLRKQVESLAAQIEAQNQRIRRVTTIAVVAMVLYAYVVPIWFAWRMTTPDVALLHDVKAEMAGAQVAAAEIRAMIEAAPQNAALFRLSPVRRIASSALFILLAVLLPIMYWAKMNRDGGVWAKMKGAGLECDSRDSQTPTPSYRGDHCVMDED